MIHLKEMDWDDKWENYIKYGKTDVDEQFKWDNFYNMSAPYIYQIISVMHQLKGKMTVYEAFLKGLEVYYCSTTCGKKSFLQNYRYVQNKIYKNIKKGIIDEFLIDVHSVMLTASIKWYSGNSKI